MISEIGRSSRAFAELACRTEPLVGDVVMALVEMGINVESVIPFSKRAHRVSLPTRKSFNREKQNGDFHNFSGSNNKLVLINDYRKIYFFNFF